MICRLLKTNMVRELVQEVSELHGVYGICSDKKLMLYADESSGLRYVNIAGINEYGAYAYESRSRLQVSLLAAGIPTTVYRNFHYKEVWNPKKYLGR